MNLVPWRKRESLPASLDFAEVWRDLLGDREERWLSRLPEVFRTRGFPAVNLAEKEDSFHITMDCPGLEERDIEVQMMGDKVLISGERKWEKEKRGKEFHRVESQYGRFERTVELPENARTDADMIDANYDKGVLTITVPKVEKTPAKKIAVRAG